MAGGIEAIAAGSGLCFVIVWAESLFSTCFNSKNYVTLVQKRFLAKID